MYIHIIGLQANYAHVLFIAVKCEQAQACGAKRRRLKVPLACAKRMRRVRSAQPNAGQACGAAPRAADRRDPQACHTLPFQPIL